MSNTFGQILILAPDLQAKPDDGTGTSNSGSQTDQNFQDIGCSDQIEVEVTSNFTEVTNPLVPIKRRLPNGNGWVINVQSLLDYTGYLMNFQQNMLLGRYIYLKLYWNLGDKYALYEGTASIQNIKVSGKVGNIALFDMQCISNSDMSQTSVIPLIPGVPSAIQQYFLQNSDTDFVFDNQSRFISVN